MITFNGTYTGISWLQFLMKKSYINRSAVDSFLILTARAIGEDISSLTSTSSYYSNNLPSIFWSNVSTTPEGTVVYQSITNWGGIILKPAMNFMAAFAGKFSASSAAEYASSTGAAVTTIWTYGQGLDKFFGGLPIFTALGIMLIINLGLIIFKTIWHLIKLIR